MPKASTEYPVSDSNSIVEASQSISSVNELSSSEESSVASTSLHTPSKKSKLLEGLSGLDGHKIDETSITGTTAALDQPSPRTARPCRLCQSWPSTDISVAENDGDVGDGPRGVERRAETLLHHHH